MTVPTTSRTSQLPSRESTACKECGAYLAHHPSCSLALKRR
jgi:hypothetical protein